MLVQDTLHPKRGKTSVDPTDGFVLGLGGGPPVFHPDLTVEFGRDDPRLMAVLVSSYGRTFQVRSLIRMAGRCYPRFPRCWTSQNDVYLSASFQLFSRDGQPTTGLVWSMKQFRLPHASDVHSGFTVQN